MKVRKYAIQTHDVANMFVMIKIGIIDIVVIDETTRIFGSKWL